MKRKAIEYNNNVWKYYTPLEGQYALQKFQSINSNPQNVYHTGWEWAMEFIPVIDSLSTDELQQKKEETDRWMLRLAEMLREEPWVVGNWPPQGKNNRVILGIDKNTGAELLLVRWSKPTPIHGHDHGHMVDVLVAGTVKEVDYKLADAQARSVVATSEQVFRGHDGPAILASGYFEEGPAQLDAFIHETIPLTLNAVTLHLVPAHPRDGKGNTFFKRENTFTMNKVTKIFYYLNLPYHITKHVVGKDHTPRHRRIAGVVVMAIGVTMAHAFAHASNIVIALAGDLVGYSIHATGFIPFAHDIEGSEKQPTKNNEQTPICQTC